MDGITMLIVKAVVQARSGKEKELEKALLDMIPEVNKEEGALIYTIHRSEMNSGSFFVFEKYIDRDAFEKHVSASYFQQLIAKLEVLADGPADVELYEEIVGLER
jgi:quinol monooxygenase YgiN